MKPLLISIAILFSISTYAQTNNTVFLKWKLQPKEILSYKTIMKEIDTAKNPTVNFSGLFNLAKDSIGQPKADSINTYLSELSKTINNTDMITNMSINPKKIIDIEMSYIQKKQETTDPIKNNADTSAMNIISKMMNQLSSGIMLRGSVNENGVINSFYLKREQKNILAMFFQLPNKEIKIGDKWPLDVNLISMDQSFKCDTSSRKNIVTLIDLNKVNGDTIATIKYDISEYVLGTFINPFAGVNVKSMMKVGLNAIGKFSTNKGRWISYDGIMLLDASGVMDSHSMKKVSLLAN